MEKKEAMKILKDFHDKSALFSVRTALDTIIPELRESEDERTRKEILELVKQSSEILDKQNQNNMIVWLEKQGYTKKDIDDAYLKGICDAKHEFEKQGEQKSVDKEYTFKSILRLLDMIEPTDRAKSYCKKLIDSLQTEGYSVDAKIVGECLKQMNGEKVAMAVMDTEKQDGQKPFDYENATIQQKDFAPNEDKPRYSVGDVLCDKSCTTLNKDAQPNFEIIDIKNGMYICDNGSFPISQQDEYELVAKKIDQTSQRMVSAEAKEALYDKPTDKEMKELLRTEYEKGRADAIAEMKSSWSEVDDIRLQDCIDCLQAKSLMGKVDTVMTNWLKSLKDRYTWKPSEEQMYNLSEAAHYHCAFFNMDVLDSLYDDLAKL